MSYEGSGVVLQVFLVEVALIIFPGAEVKFKNLPPHPPPTDIPLRETETALMNSKFFAPTLINIQTAFNLITILEYI